MTPPADDTNPSTDDADRSGDAVPRSVWVTNDFPPRSGGIEQFVVNLLATLPPETVRVLASPWEGDEQHDAGLPYRVDRVHRRPLLPTPALASTIRDAVVDHRADLVVFGSAWPLAEMGDDVGVPALAITHGREAGMVRFGFSRMMKRLARACAGMTLISEYTATRLEPLLQGLTTLHRLPGGVDTDTFTPDGPNMRVRLGLDSDRPVVVCVSRLVPRKGQDLLVRIWPRVLQQVPSAHLVIVGTGPLEEGLRREVGAQGLRRSVTLTGEVPWEALPAAYRTGDVFAMPCRTRLRGMDVEGLGLVFLEAQACGLPVIVGDSGGAPETVMDGETGIVVDPEDDMAVLEAIVALLSDPERRTAMGRAGRDHVVKRWDWRVIGDLLRHAMIATSSADSGL